MVNVDERMTPTRIKDIPGYEGLYAVTTDGKIWSYPKLTSHGYGYTHRGKFLAPCKHRRRGDLGVTLSKDGVSRTKNVARLVAITYIPNPDNKPEVNHINGDFLDNRVENLEWCSTLENLTHKIQVLKKGIGEHHGRAKIVVSDVLKIRELYATGDYSFKTLGKMFNLSKSQVENIVHRRSWAHV